MNNKLKLLYNTDGGAGGGGGGSIMTGGGAGGAGEGDKGTNGGGQQQQPQNKAAWNGAEWMATLPDDLKASKSLARFQSVADVAKAYTESEKALGSRIAIPGEKATPEERAAFFNRLGRPETPDKYDLSATKIPAGIPVDAEFTKAAVTTMHDLGLSQAQTAGLYDFVIKTSIGKFETETKTKAEARSKNEADLKKEYGKDYEGNLRLAYLAAKKFGGDAFVEWLDKSGLGDDGNFVRLFVNIGKAALTEDEASGSGGGEIKKESQAEAIAELEKIKKDPETIKILNDTQHPKRKEFLANWDRLNKLANPNPTAVS